MEELVEILDGAGIDSSRISCWIDESLKFLNWYLSLPGICDDIDFESKNHIKLYEACLNIETKMDIPFYNKKSTYGRIDKND